MAPLVTGVLPGQLEQWGCDDCEVLYVRPEKIAGPDERANGLDIRGQFCILVCLKFIFSWFNTFRSESETQVGNFLVSEKAFSQVDFQVVGMKAL
jgi:hypothetical protein